MNIVLCGLPKSGKTTIGKILAESIKRPFIDTDQLIEKAYHLQTNMNLPCRQIFLREGDLFFRTLEKEQIKTLGKHQQTVIAIGGGSILDSENTKILREIGIVYYLQAPLNKIWPRVKACGLPAYLTTKDAEDSFYKIYAERTPLYEMAAHITIDTYELSNSSVVDFIKQHAGY